MQKYEFLMLVWKYLYPIIMETINLYYSLECANTIKEDCPYEVIAGILVFSIMNPNVLPRWGQSSSAWVQPLMNYAHGYPNGEWPPFMQIFGPGGEAIIDFLIHL